MESLIRENDALIKECEELRKANQALIEENVKLVHKLTCIKMEADGFLKHTEGYKREIKQLKMIIRAFEAGSGKKILEESCSMEIREEISKALVDLGVDITTKTVLVRKDKGTRETYIVRVDDELFGVWDKNRNQFIIRFKDEERWK